MKNVMLAFSATILLLFAGCTTMHYTRVQGNTVEIFLKQKNAQSVSFACSLDRFVLHEAEKTDENTWKITVPSGTEFSYFFIVDGTVFTPKCPLLEEDDFGNKNCIYEPKL